jgi:hypothetical protein
MLYSHMFTLNQASASRRPLVSPAVLEMALCATDCPLGVFSSPTNTAINPPLAYNAPNVRPKPIEMNTCTRKRGGGESAVVGQKLLNSRGIILLHKNCQQLP